MTDQEIIDWKLKIDSMTQEEMAYAWRFHPAGHVLFQNDLPLFEYFQKKFKELGGFTPEISRQWVHKINIS